MRNVGETLILLSYPLEPAMDESKVLDLGLVSASQDIPLTSHLTLSLPNSTAWRQRHIRANNWSRVITWGQIKQPHDQWPNLLLTDHHVAGVALHKLNWTSRTYETWLQIHRSLHHFSKVWTNHCNKYIQHSLAGTIYSSKSQTWRVSIQSRKTYWAATHLKFKLPRV